HGEAVEAPPRTVGIHDSGDGGTVACENPTRPGHTVGAEGNRSGLVHRRTQRPDGRERTTSARHRPQASVPEEENALSVVPEIAIEAHRACVVQVGMTRDTGKKRRPSGLFDRPATAGEDSRAPAA